MDRDRTALSPNAHSISTLHASNRAVSLKNREGKVFWLLKFTSEIHTLAGVLVCLVEPHRIGQMKPVLPRDGFSVGTQLGPRRAGHLLGDAQCGDLGRVRVVLPVEGRVHGQLTPEHQLPFPAVPWGRKGQRMTDEARGAHV